MRNKANLKIKNSADKVFKHNDHFKAAQELDALLFFIHKRYAQTNIGKAPNLGSFLITCAEVVFSDKVSKVTLRKNPKRRTLEILAPRMEGENEEIRRIFLLNQFGDLILKYQKQGYLQVREMLNSIIAPEAQNILIQDFENYKASFFDKK